MTGLQSGLIMVAGFIGLIGMRIISFFTSKTPERAANSQPSMGSTRIALAAYADRHADGA